MVIFFPKITVILINSPRQKKIHVSRYISLVKSTYTYFMYRYFIYKSLHCSVLNIPMITTFWLVMLSIEICMDILVILLHKVQVYFVVCVQVYTTCMVTFGLCPGVLNTWGVICVQVYSTHEMKSGLCPGVLNTWNEIWSVFRCILCMRCTLWSFNSLSRCTLCMRCTLWSLSRWTLCSMSAFSNHEVYY